MHKSAWKIVDAFIEDSCPTWTSPDTASSKKRKRSSEDQAEADSAALAAQVLPWLQGTLAGLNHGIRRQNSERIILFMNLTVAGVVTASMQRFLLEWAGNILHSYSQTACCVA